MAEAQKIKPKPMTKKITGFLPEKAQDILRRRFGLDESTDRMTLESIGQLYGITRERVRQIENFALQTIRKSKEYSEFRGVLEQINDELNAFGRGLAHEEHFLDHVSGKDKVLKNHIRFYLVLGDDFERRKEDDDFHHRWVSDNDLGNNVQKALCTMHDEISDEELLSDADMLEKFASHLRNHVKGTKFDDEVMRRWLSLSKVVGRNPLGDWGKATSPNIKIRGVRDLAFLVIRRHGKPLHFSDVAKTISKEFGRPAHIATCHNELIKDDRFVLVGRGLYALKDWGYNRGTVREIIRSVLAKNGPLTKKQIVEKVTKERFVRESTISVNLQNSKYFKRDSEGRYTAVEGKK